MRVASSITIRAPIDQVWEFVSEPERVLSFMSSVTRWEVDGEQRTGLSARYRVLFRIGAAEIGGLIEIVEWDKPRELAWTSVLGIDQRGRWRLRELSGGRTKVELRMAYGVAGSGPFGWLAERIAAPSVGRHLRRSLAQLRRMIEHEQLRERAAERAAARVA
ncbi:MAG TPA: SRPBCC family protein [Solirubrobacteraceae bacterium]|nr:SRPBCC family protein [Solirubrobacteraceae bacterium]